MTKKWTERERGFIEGYAAAMDDLMGTLAESPSSKSYDPMTIDSDTMHSYAFDLKDGGRHHPLSDYESIDDVCGYIRREAIGLLNEARSDKWGSWHEGAPSPLKCWRDEEERVAYLRLFTVSRRVAG